MSQIIAKRIKQRRKVIGITQKELARRAKISLPTIKRWEDSDPDKGRTPNASMLPILAEALETTVNYLIGIDSDEAQLVPEKIAHDPTRIIYDYRDHHFDLPATPEGYKAFSEALAMFARTPIPATV